ncbi:hypothetical protein MCEMRE22_00033 [Candidatus Nanopelagicaceae bacterium]
MSLKIFVVSDAIIELDEFIRQRNEGFLEIIGVLTSVENINVESGLIHNSNQILKWGLGFETQQYCQIINFDLEKRCLDQIHIFLEMCARVDNFEIADYLVRRKLFSKLISYWGEFFSKNPSNLIFFTTTPHEIVDYCLFLVAKALNIRIIILHDIHLFGRKVASDVIESPWKSLLIPTASANFTFDFENLISTQHLDYLPPWMPSNSSRETLVRSSLSYSSRFLLRTIRCQFNLASIKIQSLLGLISIRSAIDKSNSELRKLRDSLLLRSRVNTQSSLASERSMLSFSQPPKPYVLYCMNLDPEMMVSPLGSPFVSQTQAIAKLRELIPAEIQIVVREHPLQYKIDSSYGILGRSIDFYEDIRSITNTVVSSPLTSLNTLANSAEIIVTLNGTIAWQAAVSGKKVALFGNSWIEGCPNARRFNPESTPAQMEEWMKTELTGSREDLVLFLTELFSNSFGYVSSLETASQLGISWNQRENMKIFRNFVEELISFTEL